MIVFLGRNRARNTFFPNNTLIGRIFKTEAALERNIRDLQDYIVESYFLEEVDFRVVNEDTESRFVYRVIDNSNAWIDRTKSSYQDSGYICNNRTIAESLKTTYMNNFPDVLHEDLTTITFKLTRRN